MLAGLFHPNLPRIYDHFSEAGRCYLVMDFIKGETLEDYLNKMGRKLSVKEVLNIGIQLAGVLDYLHNHHPPIIFRDLKPSNVMRIPDGTLFLIDFGIARHFKPGQIKDTVAFVSAGYAAPEQYGKAQTSPQSDIYSLEAMLHQMLSGHDPSTNSPTLFNFPPLITAPSELEKLIEQMVQVNPTNRPANMAVVKQKLQHLLNASAFLSSPQPKQAVIVPPTKPAQLVMAPPPSSKSIRKTSLQTTAVVLVVLWLLGFLLHIGGGAIHLPLLLALICLVLGLIG